MQTTAPAQIGAHFLSHGRQCDAQQQASLWCFSKATLCEVLQ